MRKRAVWWSLSALALCFFLGAGNLYAQPGPGPSLIPPVAIGADTLAGFGGNQGFYEFLTQSPPDDWKGDIGGIGTGELYWIYVMGIDATNVTGPAGRRIKFNLQDAETNSSFKHLGISFSLNSPLAGGGDLLECYQSNNDGLSTHGLAPGELTLSNFDLRFSFTKQDSTDGWTITPYYRMDNGGWTVFFDSTFVSINAFDFRGGKLVVAFEDAADGSVSFDNFFVVGPIQGPINNAYVDDDWANLQTGDAVQFPGQDQIQVMGTNGFATIDDAIDIYRPKGASRLSQASQLSAQQIFEPPTVHVAAGTYNENVLVDANVQIYGAGSGTDDQSNTIIVADPNDLPAMLIDGFYVTGMEGTPIVFKDFRVTGATGGTESGGIIVTDGYSNLGTERDSENQTGAAGVSSPVVTQYLHFENIAAVTNGSVGIGFNHADAISNIDVINCDLSNNTLYGFYIPSSIISFDGLNMKHCQINDNGVNGLTTGPNGSMGVNNVNIDSTSFSGNGNALSANGFNSGDISFLLFNGNASVTNVSITGDGAHIGLQMRGYDALAPAREGLETINGGSISPSGVVVLDSVRINGTYQDPASGAGSGLLIADYSDVSGISFNNVVVDVIPSLDIPDGAARGDATSGKLRFMQNGLPPAERPVINLNLDTIYGNLDISNTVLGGNAMYDIMNFAPGTVDATSATFSNAANNFEIEDRVFHAMDLEITGLVTWVPSNLFMTKNSFATPDTSSSIERAIHVASSNDTLNIAPAAFFDSSGVKIDKNLVILGAGKDVTTFHALQDTGFLPGDDYWFRIDSLVTVHMRGLTLDGTGQSIYYAIRADGGGTVREVCFRDIVGGFGGGIGIHAAGTGPMDVESCTFEQMGRGGVQYYGVGTAGSEFRGNTYTGKGTGNFTDIAVDIDGGTNVTVIGNTISENLGTENGMVKKKGEIEKGKSALAGLIPFSQSAGVHVTTDGGPGTVATIDSNFIFNSSSAVDIGGGEVDESFVVMRGNEFYNNFIGVGVFSALFVKAEGNNVHDDTVGFFLSDITVFDLDMNEILDNQDGVAVFESFGEMDGNIISGHTNNGITIFDVLSTGVTINGNEFCLNAGYGVENQGGGTLNAVGNWWGAVDGPAGNGPGSGDSVSVDVDFSNFTAGGFFPNSPCSEFALCSPDGDVDDDGALTPGDALCAFKIFLNGQTVPADCDVQGTVCELVAADVDCDQFVTPADALEIFQGFLNGRDPEACFAQPQAVASNALNKAGHPYELSLQQAEILQPASGTETGKVKLALRVDDVKGLGAFGVSFNYPADRLDFVGIERSALTAEWQQLDGRSSEDGFLTVGGFHTESLQQAGEGELLTIVFSYKDKSAEPIEITFSDMVSDFSNAIATSETVEISGILPTSFSLQQNYPNPFNPETQIQYEIPKLSKDKVQVSLSIYNITGQLVRKLVDEKKAPGVYRATWDGKNDAGIRMSSGTYFYTIKAGDFKDSKKMLLVK